MTTCWNSVGPVTQLVKFNLKRGCLYINYKPISSLVYCPDILHFRSNIALAKFEYAKIIMTLFDYNRITQKVMMRYNFMPRQNVVTIIKEHFHPRGHIFRNKTKCLHNKRMQPHKGLVTDTNKATISFQNTYMAAMTSCENVL